jgi:hypothetical protein
MDGKEPKYDAEKVQQGKERYKVGDGYHDPNMEKLVRAVDIHGLPRSQHTVLGLMLLPCADRNPILLSAVHCLRSLSRVPDDARSATLLALAALHGTYARYLACVIVPASESHRSRDVVPWRLRVWQTLLFGSHGNIEKTSAGGLDWLVALELILCNLRSICVTAVAGLGVGGLR